MAGQGLGSFFTGALKGLSDYTFDERKAQRDREDTMLKGQQTYLDHILQGVEDGKIDPSVYHQALTDAHSAAEALASPRKSKGGKAGFFGETQLPVLPFFEAMKQGFGTSGSGDTTPAPSAPIPPTPPLTQPDSGPFNEAQRPPVTIPASPGIPGGAPSIPNAGALPSSPTMPSFPDGHPTNDLIKHIGTLKAGDAGTPSPAPPQTPDQQLHTVANSAPNIFKTPAQLAGEKADAETAAAIRKAKNVSTYLASVEFKALPKEQQEAIQRELTGFTPTAPKLGTPLAGLVNSSQQTSHRRT